jgi:hypothetical protein
MSTSSYTFRICLHFGLNPEARMTGAQIAEKFGICSASNVRQTLKDAIDADLIANVAELKGRGNRATYAAGPRLLKMRGTV